jgi:hypothetical protein
MYTAYFDESGTHDSSEALVVSGCIASDQQWQEFDREWKEALADAGVKHLHMRDFAPSLREFKDWKGDEQRRGEFIKRLVNIIRQHIRHTFSSAVILKDYQKLNEKYQLRERCSPYVICALTCVVDVAKWCNARGYIDSVTCVFEDGVKYKGEFVRFYAPSNFHKISYAKKHEFVGFQAADLIAWEHRKVYSQIVSREFKRHRKSFRALYSIPNDSGVYEESYLERLCRTFNIPLRESVDSTAG